MVKGRVPVSLVIFLKILFALKVNIYLQHISIKRRFGRFDQKTCIFFVCSLSPSIINNACPNFQTTCPIRWFL